MNINLEGFEKHFIFEKGSYHLTIPFAGDNIMPFINFKMQINTENNINK